MNRRRLEAELIRDGIMEVSGGLKNDYAGGTILNYKDRQYVANTSKGGDVDYDRPIRAVYVPVVRSSMYALFSAFDLPDSAVSNGDRDASVVAPQALFMMNGSVMLKHSKIMIHQPYGQVGGQVSDIEIQARDILAARQLLNEILADHTKQPIERIAKDTQRDHYLNAVDAKAYGLVDEILERPPKEKKK